MAKNFTIGQTVWVITTEFETHFYIREGIVTKVNSHWIFIDFTEDPNLNKSDKIQDSFSSYFVHGSIDDAIEYIQSESNDAINYLNSLKRS